MAKIPSKNIMIPKKLLSVLLAERLIIALLHELSAYPGIPTWHYVNDAVR